MRPITDREILSVFNRMNNEGKARALEYIEALPDIPRYNIRNANVIDIRNYKKQ